MIKKLMRRIFLPSGGGKIVARSVVRMARLKNRGSLKLASLESARLSQRHGVYISARAVVPATTNLPHPTGIVIGDGVVLAEHVTIYQNVTLGGARRGDGDAGNYPSVGARTTVFAGAVVVGAVSIGEDCVIGANSVVTSDVPPGATAVGAPARVIARKEVVE